MDDNSFEQLRTWLGLLGHEPKPIPPEFHSAYHEGLFPKCLDCEQPLLESQKFYEIQKIIKGKEVIFEYALCQSCSENLTKQYSQESRQAMETFFVTHYRGWSDNFEVCHFCGSARSSTDEYLASAVCQGKEMFFFIIFCQKCMEDLESRLSEKTKRVMGDFIENKFPGVPAEFSPVPLLKI